MKLKILLRQKYLLYILVGLIIFSTHLFYFIPKNEINNNLTELKEKNLKFPLVGVISPTSTDKSFLLMRLKIPSVGVDAFVEYVGLTLDGSMDTPKILENVGLFELGGQLGEIGTAVIDGHYGWENGKSAVFDNLHKLETGDKVYIENNKGEVISFVVKEIKKYDANADATDIFTSNDGKSHLNLITCDGVWNKTTKNYPDRLVVFTDKEK